MSKPGFPRAVIDKAASIVGKRARIVVEVILEKGFITTEDLKDRGYSHPPRAIKDVTDQGLPLVRSSSIGRDGRKMGSYTFGDPTHIRNDRVDGRLVFSKEFKDELIQTCGSKCTICSARLDARYLQVDHRVPYEVAGDSDPNDPKAYMPLCGSCNRAKSWSCESCNNWLVKKNPEICKTCYWAPPEEYAHIAETPTRRVDVTWNEEEVRDYDTAKRAARQARVPLPEFVKRVLRRSGRGK
jgi:hypothetical protein